MVREDPNSSSHQQLLMSSKHDSTRNDTWHPKQIFTGDELQKPIQGISQVRIN